MSLKRIKRKDRKKYQQLTFEVRERYRMKVILTVIGCMSGEVEVMREQVVWKILISCDTDQICREMLRTVVMESESILRKDITNIVTGE